MAKESLSARDGQLRHQIRGHVEVWIGAGNFLLLVLDALADWAPFRVALGADHILVAVALEVDHIVRLQLVQLDVDEDPYAMPDPCRRLTLGTGRCRSRETAELLEIATTAGSGAG